MKIALAQINPTVGDLPGNADKIVDVSLRARHRGAELVVFPELCVTGYPPMDLVENDYFIEATERVVRWIAEQVPEDVGIVIGAPVRNKHRFGKRLYNAALLFEGGQLVDSVHKVLLPTYDVFDEYRYFEPARSTHVITWRGLRLGIHLCEDMWNNEDLAPYHVYETDPLEQLGSLGAEIFINISASPFSLNKHEIRTRLIRSICRQHQIPFVLVNQVGANTELIFDGDSRVHDAAGEIVVCCSSFEEDLKIWDPEGVPEAAAVQTDETSDLHSALVLGIRDYFRKTGAFRKALVGLSGGIDSAVTCALAVEALGPENVMGITMPSEYSSRGSVEDSKALAQNLGMDCHLISITPAVSAFQEMLDPLFRGTAPGTAEENIQARSRGITLMAISNKFDYLLLTTGNKSEMAVGYATLYGDMSGGLAVLSDVLKLRVYALARYVNERAGREIIPRNSIEKPPSAELRPNQQDSDSLPPYEILDEILLRYIEVGEDLERIAAGTGFEIAVVASVLRMVDLNEYKRRQAPPGLRVTSKAFGMGRRLPIVMQWNREMLRELLSRTGTLTE